MGGGGGAGTCRCVMAPVYVGASGATSPPPSFLFLLFLCLSFPTYLFLAAFLGGCVVLSLIMQVLSTHFHSPYVVGLH